VELGTDILNSRTIVLLKVDDDTVKGSWELYKQRAEINLSFTDCSTAVLAKTHDVSDIFTYDDDFNALRFHGLRSV
jgi:predicted nucleic acid-binding protein